MIPEFPNFKKIELSDKKEIEKFVSKFPPYSTFNFTNLWAWDVKNNRKISKLHGNLVFLYSVFFAEKSFISFLGNNKCEDTAIALLSFANNDPRIYSELRFITEESARQLQSAGLLVEEDCSNFDYIFSPPKLAELQGIKFKKIRRLSKKFSEDYPDAVFQLKDLDDLLIQKKIHLMLRQWECRKKAQNKTCDDIEFEKRALCRLMKDAKNNKLILSCVFLHDAMLGFSIDEILPGGSAIAHFIKADNSFRGIYEFFNRELAQYLTSLDIKIWNWQQDLNIKNLREAKLGYRPSTFLKRYAVSLNDVHEH